MQVKELYTMWRDSNGNVYGNQQLDYNIFDIDKQNGLKAYTNYEFSTSDKIHGTVAGATNVAKKDINKATSFISDSSSYIQKGAKVLIFLLAATLVINLSKELRKWT